MANLHIHYEAAFQNYLRARGWPYIPIDEQKKAELAGARLKSFDFVVYPPGRPAWLCDVKGRKFPYEVKGGRRYWENWVTREDLAGLRRWREVFGDGFEPMIVFAYWLLADPGEDLPVAAHVVNGRCYAFLCLPAASYEASARQRSSAWDTVDVPRRTFRELAIPMTVR